MTYPKSSIQILNLRSRLSVLACVLLASLFHSPAPAAAASPPYRLSADPVFDKARGVWRYEVDSPFQHKPNAVEVLLPDDFDAKATMDASKPYRVLYVLPVEAAPETKWGDGLQEVRKADAHNRHRLICVAPAFDTLPWYADHPTDPKARHESYLKRAVVPLIESRYPTPGTREGRLLLGFSKSGWGAFALVLRDPDFWGYAASWDAPLLLDGTDLGVFGTGPQFGTRENFEQYLPSRLAERQAEHFRDRTRLVLSGTANFGPEPAGRFKDRPHTAAFHDKLTGLGIRHVYRDDLKVRHHWESGWVKPVVDALAQLADAPTTRPSTGPATRPAAGE